QNRPPPERQPGDIEKLRKASARFELAEVEPRGAYKPAFAPDPGPERRPPLRAVALARQAPQEPAGLGKSRAETDSPSAEHKLLYLLLDTRKGMALLLLLAAAFGAAHALTPGHGKTL